MRWLVEWERRRCRSEKFSAPRCTEPSSSDEKLARVKELGLQHAINYKQRDYEEAIKEMTEGRRRGCGV